MHSRLRLKFTLGFGFILFLVLPTNRYHILWAPNLEAFAPVCGRSDQPIDRQPNCSKIFAGDQDEICAWRDHHVKIASEQAMLNIFANCSSFLANRRYPLYASTPIEKQFPIAYSISVHNNAQQLERLLRLIYWPQNLYCIHVDKKAPETVHGAIKALANCFPNVVVAKSEHVYWAGFGVLKAVLNCMESAVNTRHQWKYFLNLASQDFPLKTNLELVQILRALNGSNNVELLPEGKIYRYWYRHRIKRNADGVPFTHSPDYSHLKLPVPHNLRVFKGNLAAALSREFVEWLLSDRIAVNFTDWLKDTDTADEHLWPTLNHNIQAQPPGGSVAPCKLMTTKDDNYFTRFVLWRDSQSQCHGKYVRDVCVYGVGDLRFLRDRRELFVNKLHLDHQSAAYDCLEDWFHKKVEWMTRLSENDLLGYRNKEYRSKNVTCR